MKKILVTGGAGFLGSHLCEYLLNQGHFVVCVDSFFSGKKENIEHLLANKKFVLVKHNIIKPLPWKYGDLDEIYNLACPASPLQYQFDPVLTLKTSVDGMENMLNLARKYNAKIIQVSTSEVYGDPLEHPQNEDYFGNVNPIGKRSCYDEGKRAAESLCKDYREQYGVDARIVRLFNVYGPHMMFNDGRVVSSFILQSLLGEDIAVHGTGDQSRSFMYVDDLIDALVKLMVCPGDKCGLGPYNIGNPDERTIKNLAENIKNLADSSSRIIYISYDKIPSRLGDPQRRCPDISRIKQLLDWQPRVSFEEGLEKTIADFRKRLQSKTKIIIFTPVVLPEKHQAAEALAEITKRLSGYEFDILTPKGKTKLASIEKNNNVNIYRLGFGFSIDKHLFLLLGLVQAWRLHQKNHYQAAWGIMAGYAAAVAALFSLRTKVGVMLSLYEGKIDYYGNLRHRLLLPFFKRIYHFAHRLQIVASLSQQQVAWLSDEKVLRPLDLERGWDYVAQETKSEFQYLEILTSRL